MMLFSAPNVDESCDRFGEEVALDMGRGAFRSRSTTEPM